MKDGKRALYDLQTSVTAKISDICRFIGLGLIAIFYTYKSVAIDDDFGWFNVALLYGVGILGVVSIFLDYVQYLLNYRAIDKAIASENGKYDDQKYSYYWFAEQVFWWKQRVVLAGGGLLVALVLRT